jgi:ATP-dependent phosphofructokinase / diphosphate-dependent phosphofructokinase
LYLLQNCCIPNPTLLDENIIVYLPLEDIMTKKAVGILVGGGPAPGINGVISAATIAAISRGHRVFGIMQGFELIGTKDLTCAYELTISDVSRIHSDGGSILGTSRFNPKTVPGALETIVETLHQLNIGYLVTIGGDDTASSASAVAQAAQGQIAVGHVPKTIDNDLPLPDMTSTFGFQSARDVGTEIAETLMVDAKTTSRWYFIVAMGRKSGHLALGIGMSSGSTLTLIPEEFGEEQIPLSTVVDIITGTILRRLSHRRPYGVVILAEGLAENLQLESIPELANAERDPHGHIRFAEVEFGTIVKNAVKQRLKSLGVSTTIVDKDVGYELRCQAPNPFDREYTRQLGYGVIEFLANGGTEAMVIRKGDELIPIPFSEMIDPQTGKASIRLVDTNSAQYKIARRYMIRLSTKQLEDLDRLNKIASHTNLSAEQLKQEFEFVADKYGWC